MCLTWGRLEGHDSNQFTQDTTKTGTSRDFTECRRNLAELELETMQAPQASQMGCFGVSQKKICAREKRAETVWCGTDLFLTRHFWQHIASGDTHGNVRDCEDSSRWERSCQKTNLQKHKGMTNLTASFCV